MAQAITPELEAILKSKLQAGSDGFRGRVEVDVATPGEASPLIAGSSGNTPVNTTSFQLPSVSVPGDDVLLVAFTQIRPVRTITLPGDWDARVSQDSTGLGLGEKRWQMAERVVGTGASPYADTFTASGTTGWNGVQCGFRSAGAQPTNKGATYERYLDGGGSCQSAPTVDVTLDEGAPDTGHTLIAYYSPSACTGGFTGTAGYNLPDGWQELVRISSGANVSEGVLAFKVVDGTGDEGPTLSFGTTRGNVQAGMVMVAEYNIEPSSISLSIITHSHRAIEISIDKSLRLDADQADVVLSNEGVTLGWAEDLPYPTNSRVRIFEWYGDPANEIRTFTGILDSFTHSRDPLVYAMTCSDMFGVLIDDRFSATGPQGLTEDDAVRTEDNGVYEDVEVDYIVADCLDRAGFPAADRDIAETSFALREYIIGDGTSRAETILDLAAMVGYSAWCDELGVFHFQPTFAAGAVLDPPDPAYTFRAGEDIVSLSDSTDQEDLVTRVKARGPLTSLKDAWNELWRTRKIERPLDVWFDGDAPQAIYVLDKVTKRLYRLRQSDRKILGYTSLGGVIPYPATVSGDPANDDRYWVASLPHQYGLAATNNKLYKIRRSDRKVVARMSLPDGVITALKVSEDWIWFTRTDTERLYKRNRSDASAVDSWTIDYWTHDPGIGDQVQQVNPRSLMIDGSTLWVFWTNGDKIGRWLVSDEATPDTIDNAVYMSGTRLRATEISTDTHMHAFGVHPANGIVAKFRLDSPFDEAVYAEVVDVELEDELGANAQLEPREHDAHPDDPDHPYEARRETLDMPAIVSLAQATEVASRTLEVRGRRRRVLDVGILGNPALQKTDVVRVEDPVSGIARRFTIDSLRDRMADTYLGTLALIPVDEPDDEPVDDGDAESELEGEDDVLDEGG